MFFLLDIELSLVWQLGRGAGIMLHRVGLILHYSKSHSSYSNQSHKKSHAFWT